MIIDLLPILEKAFVRLDKEIEQRNKELIKNSLKWDFDQCANYNDKTNILTKLKYQLDLTITEIKKYYHLK